jgi:hypothetical protein
MGEYHLARPFSKRMNPGRQWLRTTSTPAPIAGQISRMRIRLQPWAALLLLAVQVPAAMAAGEAIPSEGQVRRTAFEALNRCSTTRKQQACLEASDALQALIRQEEGAAQRIRQPRCFGALTHAETVLATFRWQLERSDNLQRVIDAAAQQCPEASGAISQ